MQAKAVRSLSDPHSGNDTASAGDDGEHSRSADSTEEFDQVHEGQASESQSSTLDRRRSREATSAYEHDLYWLLLSKATTQMYGLIFSTFLEQTVTLNGHIWYWEEVLDDRHWTGIYYIQTSPMRFLSWGSEVFREAKAREGRGVVGELENIRSTGVNGWKAFYGIVQDVVKERRLLRARRYVLSPLSVIKDEVRGKRAALQRMKFLGANALGVLLGEGLSQDRYAYSVNSL